VGLTWQEDGSLNDFAGDHWEGMKKSRAVGNCGQPAGGDEALLMIHKDSKTLGLEEIHASRPPPSLQVLECLW
jgi:hypothetical protein